MKSDGDLRKLLHAIDHRGYPAYKDTRGTYAFQDYVLSIDHVQGDPFAAPSRVSIRVEGRRAGFPQEYYHEKHRRIALQDLLTRLFHRETARFSHQAVGSGKSGLISVCDPGQEILMRSACVVEASSGDVIFRLEIGFPANGRSINAGELIRILYDFLPVCVARALLYHKELAKKYEETLYLADDQLAAREQMISMGLCAFVANGSVLPRQSGVSSLPMKDAVAFHSPEGLTVTLNLPHRGAVSGMGIRRGITLIVGGGYHGKSTLLKALELGVYDHIAGDGRELVFTEETAVKIRAEDGRSVRRDDISLFIRDLPDGRDTCAFSTEDASGSTSQAANVVEAIEAGAHTLLIDEDTCATNFMVRDALMQAVISREQEPITPFIERMRALYEQMDVSCVLVAGSSGAFFEVADTVIQMDRYVPADVTDRAKSEAARFARENRTEVLSGREQTPPPFKAPSFARIPLAMRELAGDRVKMKTLGRDGFTVNHETVDLRYVEQLVDREQSAALARLLLYAQPLMNGKRTLQEVTSALSELLAREGFNPLFTRGVPESGLALPRQQEILACFNRCRFLELKK